MITVGIELEKGLQSQFRLAQETRAYSLLTTIALVTGRVISDMRL